MLQLPGALPTGVVLGGHKRLGAIVGLLGGALFVDDDDPLLPLAAHCHGGSGLGLDAVHVLVVAHLLPTTAAAATSLFPSAATAASTPAASATFALPALLPWGRYFGSEISLFTFSTLGFFVKSFLLLFLPLSSHRKKTFFRPT